MTYLDIFEKSISHLTEIETEFVKVHFKKFVGDCDCDAKLVHDVMWKKLPDEAATQIVEKLKSGSLADAMQFFAGCFQMYHKEVVRQSIMN